MKLIVRNAAQDPDLEARRKAHPGKFCLAPLIDGKPLKPRTTRVLLGEDVTKSLALQLSLFWEIGLVRITTTGTSLKFTTPYAIWQHLGLDVDAASVLAQLPTRAEIRDARPEKISKAAVTSPESKPEPEPEQESISGDEDEEEEEVSENVTPEEESDQPLLHETLVPPDAVASDVDDFLDDVAEEDGPSEDTDLEEFECPEDIFERLEQPRVVTNRELSSILSALGGTGSGKSKSTLIDEIVERLTDPEVDVVRKHRAMALLTKAEQA